MGIQHKCELDIREKKEVLEQLKEIVALMSSCKKKLKTGPSPDKVPLCMTKRLPRFQKNYDLIPLVTSVPVLEIRPTSNQKVLRSECENPNVAYIKIEVDGNPFKTDWDEMREARRTVCPKHDVKYGAHVHDETLSEQGCIGGCEIESSKSDISQNRCFRCSKTIVPPAEMLANMSSLRLDTVCLCEAFDCYFHKEGLIVEQPKVKRGSIKKSKKNTRYKEICFCNPKKDQKVTYLCDCKPPTCLPRTK